MPTVNEHFLIETREDCNVLHLVSTDSMNRLSTRMVRSLSFALENLEGETRNNRHMPLVIMGNSQYFSVGADLNEIAGLKAADALDFARTGQQLMNLIDHFPASVYAAIAGYCMGGGFDLALACDFRICSPNAIFGHRGAALGLITGWGGTQRLANLIGRARALQTFASAQKLGAAEAMEIGLITEIAPDPFIRCLGLIAARASEFADE
ncbi:MAG TPA: enoyl-CoA hydratase/isomerase family protein [Terriglobales bacterium]|nr:enoyl-CoA hydratase/isomerase family protein [Terriglobales bacterium]